MVLKFCQVSQNSFYIRVIYIFLRLQVTTSKRHVTASVLHHTGVVPVMATTAEWAVRKQLFRFVYFSNTQVNVKTSRKYTI